MDHTQESETIFETCIYPSPAWLILNMIINVYKHPMLEVQIQRSIVKFFENEHADNTDKEEEIDNMREREREREREKQEE